MQTIKLPFPKRKYYTPAPPFPCPHLFDSQTEAKNQNWASTQHLRHRAYFVRAWLSPCPTKVQAAVDLAVELGVVDVEGEGKGEADGGLHLRLELAQPRRHLHRVLVEHKLHQVRVLQHKYLDRRKRGMRMLASK